MLTYLPKQNEKKNKIPAINNNGTQRQKLKLKTLPVKKKEFKES